MSKRLTFAEKLLERLDTKIAALILAREELVAEMTLRESIKGHKKLKLTDATAEPD